MDARLVQPTRSDVVYNETGTQPREMRPPCAREVSLCDVGAKGKNTHIGVVSAADGLGRAGVSAGDGNDADRRAVDSDLTCDGAEKNPQETGQTGNAGVRCLRVLQEVRFSVSGVRRGRDSHFSLSYNTADRR